MKTYFSRCNTIEELKQEYRRLVKQHHPDCGGSELTMKAINAEYDTLFNSLKAAFNSQAKNENNQNTEQPEDFRNIINALMKYSGITVEICGSWIWVSGNTFNCKAELKAMGFKWASKKQMWYLGQLQRKNRKSMPMETIRSKYGSDVYKSNDVLCLA